MKRNQGPSWARVAFVRSLPYVGCEFAQKQAVPSRHRGVPPGDHYLVSGCNADTE